MSTHRAHIALSPELLAEIDQVVGPRKRSAFITRVAEAELRRIRQLAMLDELEVKPAWRDEDHPELAAGSGEWVRRLRAESERPVEDGDKRLLVP